MNNSFALDGAEQQALIDQPTVAWTYVTHPSVEVEQQLTALKQSVAAWRQRETVAQPPGEVSPPLAAPTIPVEIQLSYIETATGLLVMSFVIDITERKRAATALRKQRDFLQLVIDSVPTLIMVKDRANRFQLVNQGFAQRYGATPADLMGKPDLDLLGSQAEPHVLSQCEQAVLATGQPLFIPVEKLFDPLSMWP